MRTNTKSPGGTATAPGACAGAEVLPRTSAPRVSIFERFASKVDVSGGPDACWIWTGRAHDGSYGQLHVDGKPRSAHRVSWELFRFPIPNGLYVLHNCPGGDCPACVNPGHLFLGTQAENMADKKAKGRVGRSGNGRRKLTRDSVLEIRRRLADGESGQSLAKHFGVTAPLISCIRSGRVWKGAVPA